MDVEAPGLWLRAFEQLEDPRMDRTKKHSLCYNGHFACTCYHPLFFFNQFGDLERALLRNGNVASAEHWRSVLEPIIARCRALDISRFFRGDAAFARPELYECLEAESYLIA
jgi:hypothetical protein